MLKLQLPKGAFELGQRIKQVKPKLPNAANPSGYGESGVVTGASYTIQFDMLADGTIRGVVAGLNYLLWDYGDGEQIVHSDYMALAVAIEIEVEIE